MPNLDNTATDEADLDSSELDGATSQVLEDKTLSKDAASNKEEDKSISGLISSFELLDFKDGPEQFSWFPKLPAEIRLAIWDICLASQTQQRRLQGLYPYDTVRFPCPVVAHVCRESRNEALKGFRSFEVKLDASDVGNENKSAHTWVNHHQDVILLSNWTHSWPAWVLPFFPTARTLASYYPAFVTEREYASLLVKDVAKCSVFPALETLLVVLEFRGQKQLRVDIPSNANVDASSDSELSWLPAYPYERQAPVVCHNMNIPIISPMHMERRSRHRDQDIYFKGKRILLDLYKDDDWEALNNLSSTNITINADRRRASAGESLQKARTLLKQRWEQTAQPEIHREFEKALGMLYTRSYRSNTAVGSESNPSREEWMDEQRKKLPKISPAVMVDIARRQGRVSHMERLWARPDQQVQAHLRLTMLSFDKFGWGFPKNTSDDQFSSSVGENAPN